MVDAVTRIVRVAPGPGVSAALVGWWVCLQRFVKGDPGRPDRWEIVPGALPVGPWETSHQAELARENPQMLADKVKWMQETQVKKKNIDSRAMRRQKYHDNRRARSGGGSEGTASSETPNSEDKSSNEEDGSNT